jgi:hypothetical protein
MFILLISGKLQKRKWLTDRFMAPVDNITKMFVYPLLNEGIIP